MGETRRLGVVAAGSWAGKLSIVLLCIIGYQAGSSEPGRAQRRLWGKQCQSAARCQTRPCFHASPELTLGDQERRAARAAWAAAQRQGQGPWLDLLGSLARHLKQQKVLAHRKLQAGRRAGPQRT